MAANREWNSHGDEEERLRLLDFIDPESESLKPILNAAKQKLADITQTCYGRAFDELGCGYVPPSDWKDKLKLSVPEWVSCLAEALYEGLRSQKIGYAVEKSWESTVKEQEIRTYEELLGPHELGGPCLDLVLLFAACLERVGLHPLVIIIDEPPHAILGYWLEERFFDEKTPATEVCPIFQSKPDLEQYIRQLKKKYPKLDVKFIECTGFSRGEDWPFARAQREGEEGSKQPIRFILDVRAARLTALSREMRDYMRQVQADALTLPPAFGFPPGVSFPKIRVRVKVRKEPRRFSKAEARAWETARREGMDEESTKKVYQYPHPWPEEWEREAERPLDWDREVRGRTKRAVILSDPGFGKTFLLKHEALQLAEGTLKKLKEYPLARDEITLPIFLPLAQLAKQMDKKSQPLAINEALVPALEGRYPIGKELKIRIETNLNSERCMLLLDALDEVIPGERQQELCECLDDFARKYVQLRILLTSRLVGYPGAPFPLPQEGEFELLPFDRRQQQEFARAWFAGRPDRGDLFLRKLRESPQLYTLAGVPLLLALMCRLFDERDELPRSRAELYEACIWGILTQSWKEWEEGRKPRPVDNPYLHANEEIAYELFVDEKESFYLGDLLDVIEDIFRSQPRLEQSLQNKSPADVIAELQEDGLLIKAGTGVNPPYLFLHLTFQEYSTACALARRTGTVNLDGKQVPEWLKIVKPHFFDPRWEEVIRLLDAKLEDATPLIEAIWQEPEDLFLGRLRLAGKCLVDAPRVQDQLHKEIIEEVLALMRNAIQRRGETPTKQQTILKSQPEKFERLVGTIAAAFDDVFQKLLSMLKEEEGGLERAGVDKTLPIRALGETYSEQAVPLLISLLQDPDVRWAAAEALGKIGSEQAVPRLIDFLQDPDPVVSGEAAAEALEAISRKQGIRILLDGSYVKIR